MKRVYPDYYEEFRCLAGACRHSCCIGWEIDIDGESLARFQAQEGPLGMKLRQNIDPAPTPHFRLGAGERCPFLQTDGLCELILGLGEESLCQICREHPRFHNELPGRVESGLGLCCEAAGRLILGRAEPVQLRSEGEDEAADDILALRDRALTLLQDRSRSIPVRVEALLALCYAEPPAADMAAWAEVLLELERLDEAWTERLAALRDGWATADLAGFDRHMEARQTEYEQLLVYLVYRHLANACDAMELSARAGFAALAYELLRAMGAVQWTETGVFTPEDQVELGRLFSSEIEYSDENMEILLDEYL